MAKIVEGATRLWRRAQTQLQADYAFYDTSHQLPLSGDIASSQPLISLSRLTNLSSSTSSTSSSSNDYLSLIKHKQPLSFFDHLCQSKEGWGPTSPYRDLDFTPCFQDVALTVAPAVLLAFFASFGITRIARAPARSLSKASYTILVLKNGLLTAVAICAALEVSTLFQSYKYPFQALPLWASIASLASYALALPLQYYNHTRARRSSTILLFFWLFHIVASVIRLRTLATYPSPPIQDNMMTFVLQATRLSLVVVVFTLECVGVGVGGPRPSTIKVNGHSSGPSLDNREASTFSNISEEGGGYDATLNPLGEKECPENVANIFSRLTFHWLQPMMTLGSKKFLTEEDMWTLPPGEDAENLGKRFEKYYAECRGKDGKSRFWTTLFYSYGGPFMFAALLKAAQDILAFAQPQLLRLLLQFVESKQSDDPQSTFHGYLFSILLFTVATVQTCCLHAYFQRCFTTGMRVRAGLVSAIFNKSLRLSNEDRGGRATGDIVNLMSVDASRLQDLCTYGHVAWSALLQMTLAFVSLYNLLGWPSFIGVGIMIVSIPVNTALARYMRSLSERTMKVKDRRTRLMNEILTNIKSIKLFAWEEAFSAKLYQVRNNEELVLLKKAGMVNAFFNFFWTAIPFLVSLSTFIVYSATTDKALTADIIFPALSLYQLLSFPLAMFAGIIAALIQAMVSANRLSSFLDAGELDPQARKVILPANPLDPLLPDSPADEAQMGDGAVVTMKNAEFKWSRNQPVPTLSDIDLTVKKGELLAVLGRVGDGKSSLLSAILGEMYRSDGQCIIRGRTAYFTQGGWCMGASIRDNILFGLKYEPDFYQRVLEACALPSDLAILPEGDMTEVGEKGVSLSGGQRARVALARACYARADIYLLDDPLAAVDAHVGAHIFKNVIGPEGLLKTKTRILTTNMVSFLPEADQIVSLRRGVFLQERGTYEQVMEARGDIFNLINGLGKQSASRGGEEEEESQEEQNYEKQGEETLEVIDHDKELAHVPQGEEAFKETKLHRRMSTASMQRPKPLTKSQIKRETLRQLRDTTQQKEISQQGSVSREVYKQYTSSASVLGVAIYLIAQIMTQVLQVSRDIVLKQWGQHNSATGGSTSETRFYLTLYGLVGLAASVTICVAPFVLYTWLSISSAKRFHDGMFRSILFAPLQWFETIPTGRLLNLFSRDVNVIDETLPRVLHSFIRTMIIVIGVLVVISVSVPPFLLAVVPLWFIYRAILRYYLATSRELKRLDAVSKSPIFTWFQESLGGLSTIRAFGQETRFLATSEAKVDRNQMCYFPSITCNRWLAVRVELIGAFVILLASTLAVTLVARDGSKMDAGLLGLMMSQALSTTQSLNWVVRSASEVEQNIVSVERVLNYSETESEAPYEVEEKPGKEWPTQGKIEFRNYSTRYRKDLDLVLRNVSFTIEDRERIAVVGRTGAGKSSLTLALFRIIEPAEGTILIDDYDCKKLGLKDLRSHIAIIPQDPQLWEGTLRDNIDPTGTYSDEQMWKSLAQARLKDHVMTLEGGLDALLTEGASNFSSGQRQLLCVARALLQGSKILVLDEATSSVDLQSDALIQDMIRNELSEKTLITIAHRLWTIISYDRVAVFDHGKLAEFDTPLNLYDKGKNIQKGGENQSQVAQEEQQGGDSGALFFSMCEKAGISREEIVKARQEM